MATTLQKQIIDRPGESIYHGLLKLTEQLSEYFWFLLSFALFVLLGPFSAPVVLIALCKLGMEESDQKEPESLTSQ